MSTSPPGVDGRASVTSSGVTPVPAASPPSRRRCDPPHGQRTIRRVKRVLTLVGLLLLATVAAWHIATARAADAAQQAMADEWARHVATTPPMATGAEGPVRHPAGAGPRAAPLGDAAAIARVVVRRPGSGQLLDGAFFVSEGIDQAQIDRGPSHYPASALPGHDGNFAIAGHRTTHGAPFGDLDQLRPGDEVRVTDRAGRRFVYRVVDQRVVSPTDTWVVGRDPLGSGRPMLTFTTCHPRFSARQRLVVWAELQPPAAREVTFGPRPTGDAVAR